MTSIVGERAFETRDDAIAALKAAGRSLDVQDRLLLVDLYDAQPIVLVVVDDAQRVSPVMRAETGPETVAADDAERSELWWLDTGSVVDAVPGLMLLHDEALSDESPGVDPGQLTFEEVGAAESSMWEVGSVVEADDALADPSISDHVDENTVLPGEREDALPDQRPFVGEAHDFSEWDDAGADALPESSSPEASESVGHTVLDFGSWTCEDCLFTGACSRAGTDTPATCGYFQLR